MKHDHSQESHETLTVAEFFEEYWVVLFFGTFFLMTLFLPLLFLDNRNWFYWSVVITLLVALGLLVVPALMGPKKQS